MAESTQWRPAAGQIALSAPVRVRARQLSHHDPSDLRPCRFRIRRIHAVVADHRRRHHDDLTAIRRIGERFLIPAHVRRKHDFGDAWAGAAMQVSTKQGSIFEEKEPWCTAA